MSKIDDLIRRVAAGSAPSPQVIRAYHGSPYDFDRFDASKIGTGEGAQAYGYGLYFAGNEKVAKSYRDGLSGSREILVGGEPVPYSHMYLGQDAERSPRMIAIRELQRQSYDLDDPMEALRRTYRHILDKPADADRRAALLAALDHMKSSGVQFGRRPGHSYEVEIGYPESSLLDFDKPLSNTAGATAASILRDHNPAAISAATLRDIETGDWRFGDARGANRAALEMLRLARTKAGANALRASGIPGVRYLDEGSRLGDDALTRNYVIFPGAEDSIRILRKYAVPGVVGTGAAAMSGEE